MLTNVMETNTLKLLDLSPLERSKLLELLEDLDPKYPNLNELRAALINLIET